MSPKLAIATAVSVLMMSAYVLLGADAARAPFGPSQVASEAGVSASTSPAIELPRIDRLLPSLH